VIAPPGWGKTDTLVEFAGWALGQTPEEGAFGFFSYNDNIATERSMAVRTCLTPEPSEMNERFALVFPGLKPARDRPWSQERWYPPREGPEPARTRRWWRRASMQRERQKAERDGAGRPA